MRRKLGDRRAGARYDLVGELWGILETTLRLTLKDVSHGGALIESPVAFPAGSLHRLTFDCEGQETAIEVRVRHAKPVIASDGRRTFLVGIEFLSVHPPFAGQVRRWMAAAADDGAPA